MTKVYDVEGAADFDNNGVVRGRAGTVE